MSQGFRSPVSKDTVRSLWCTQILTALRNEIGRKYFYLGLPGPEAKDLKEWHKEKLVGRVCAFQMLDTKGEDEMASITQLESYLAQTFAPMRIPYSTYLGLLEDVLINGRDALHRQYRQDALVTLYQLDFCHALTDRSWQTIRLNLRYEAIRRLMVKQCEQTAEEKARPFVLFLTVRDEIDTTALMNFADRNNEGPNGELVRALFKDVPIDSSKKKQVRHPGLKGFVYCTLNDCLRGLNMRSLFLPPVYYVGRRSVDPMVVYAVLGAFDSMTASSPRTLQSLKDFLTTEGLQLTNGNLVSVNRCCIETQKLWGVSGVLQKYIKQFLSDPAWKKLTAEAEAARVRRQ
jgi:hypothetical protein